MSRAGWLGVAALCAALAAGWGALSQAYRGTLVRELRTRHPAEWIAAGRPASGVSGEPGLLGFARSQRYFTMNDADMVSAARNFYYNRLAAYLFATGALGGLAIAARRRSPR